MKGQSVYEWIRGRTWMAELETAVRPKLKAITFGPSPPNVFVGEYGYPSVRAGPMLALEDNVLDAPADLYGLAYPELLRQRAFLARGFTVRNVSRAADEALWIAASEKQVDVEAEFFQAPRFDLSFSTHVQPLGPSGQLKRFRATDNPVVPKKIDALMDEKLKVSEALPELMGRFDYHYIQKLLSAGILGEKPKLVPTKWSITATDDMLAKQMLQDVRNNAEVGEYRIYSNNYLYNHFEVLLMPGAWEFEQFESFEGSINLEHEYEPNWGRTKYAATEGGGYYAGRYGVVEALYRLKKQARCVVFREVAPEYQVPVGVWEVRENVRHSFEMQPFKTTDFKDAITELKKRLKRPWREYTEKSRILGQKTLTQYR
ncbi:hypothetical protein HY994_01245 [Candidatus Micrarchaeota archaeon]|nr:hypothetical protein [Candidatus Micrarchaeota archaeon]